MKYEIIVVIVVIVIGVLLIMFSPSFYPRLPSFPSSFQFPSSFPIYKKDDAVDKEKDKEKDKENEEGIKRLYDSIENYDDCGKNEENELLYFPEKWSNKDYIESEGKYYVTTGILKIGKNTKYKIKCSKPYHRIKRKNKKEE
jgi:hypothetical protein